MYKLVEHPDGSPITFNGGREVKLIDSDSTSYIMVGGDDNRERAIHIATLHNLDENENFNENLLQQQRQI